MPLLSLVDFEPTSIVESVAGGGEGDRDGHVGNVGFGLWHAHWPPPRPARAVTSTGVQVEGVATRFALLKVWRSEFRIRVARSYVYVVSIGHTARCFATHAGSLNSVAGSTTSM